MPNRSAKPCGKPGCPRLVRGPASRCTDHASERERARGTATSRGYGADWRTLRAAHLLAHPVCSHQDCTALATDVDHVTPHRGDDALRLDPDNLQSLCHSHHSQKTATEDGGFGKQRVVRPSRIIEQWEPSV